MMSSPRPCRLRFEELLRKPRTVRPEQDGFTLAELLVVVATIAILATVLLPAVAGTNPDNRAFRCLNNLRRLTRGWQMYAMEYHDNMLPNAPLGSPTDEAWCNAQLGDNWTTSSDNTNRTALLNSLLGPYLAEQITAYHCPADDVPSLNGFRLRSYSMNSQMGNVYLKSLTRNFNPGYLAFVKVTELTKLAPAKAFIFCGENVCSMNDGYLQVDCNFARWPDVPASYHAGSGGFSFADGHAAMRGWVTPALKIPVRYGYTANNIVAYPGGKNNADWVWFTQHATVHQ